MKERLIYKMQKIDTVLLFAAGLGTRMSPLTKYQPKSLIKILNKPILYYVLEICVRSNLIRHIIINTHYMAEQIRNAVNDFQIQYPNSPNITVIHEDVILETGGTVKNIASFVDNKPIFTINTEFYHRFAKRYI